MRVGYRIRKGFAVLAMVGFCSWIVLGAASCQQRDIRGNVAAAADFPDSLDQLLHLTFGEDAAVRFSRTGESRPQVVSNAIPGFGPSSGPIERVRLAREVERHLDRLPDPERLHALGVYRAVEGELDRAVAALEAATLEEPTRADLWADLGAIHLLRYREAGRFRDLIGSLRSSERSLGLEPRGLAAAFNRAEALTDFFLVEQGLAAWEVYLRLDSRGAWSAVAERRRESLNFESVQTRCERAKRATLAAWDRERSVPAELVRELPHCFRMWVLEEHLPAWARSWRAGESAASDRLDLAGSIGASIVAETGDHLLSDSIGPIEERIRVGDRFAVDRMAEALHRLGVGLDAYRRQDFSEVRPAMEEVVRDLRGVIAPLAGLASYHLAVLDYYAGPGESAPGFEEIVSDLPIDRYPHLQGFCTLMLGTIMASDVDPESGVELYQSARPLLQQSAGDVVGMLLYPSLGDGLRLVGLEEQAWSVYLLGLEASARSGNRKRYATALYTVVELLLESGDADVASVLGDELVENAREADLPSVVSQAYLQRGRARHALGLGSEAVADLDLAGDWADQIEGGDHRERIDGAIDLALAALEVETVPAASLERLDRLVEERTEQGYLYRMPQLLLLRSRALGALGYTRRQEEDLLTALQLSERPREEAENPGNRRALFAQARAIYEETVKFRIGVQGLEAAAFEIAEHGRARELGESLGLASFEAVKEGFRPYGLQEIQARLPLGTVIIEYFVLADRLVTWTISRHEFQQRVQAMDRNELTDRIARFLLALERRAPEDGLRSQSAELHRLLLADALAGVPSTASLVFVPDRYLAEVPFAALYDPESSKYLVADHPVAESPSAAVYTAKVEQAKANRRSHTVASSILAVGDPAFSARSYPRLERLPTAGVEAHAVGAAYARGETLTGAQATEAAVVSALGRHPVAYFATHAVVDPAVPERSALILAATDGADGRLTAEEIARLDLSGVSLIVLAVCDPVQGSEHGDEGLTGLVAAFLRAGAGAVVAPTRPVGETSTTWLLEFQRSVAGGRTAATAFREAQENAMASLPAGEWSAFRWIGAMDSGEEN